jgi:hypothetical protein
MAKPSAFFKKSEFGGNSEMKDLFQTNLPTKFLPAIMRSMLM